MNKGFSIVELLVISAIIATFSVVLILNFRSSPTSKTALEQTASVVLSDIRRAQSLALSGSRYRGNLVCGYGFHYVDSVSYLVYAKAVPTSGSCSSIATRNYESSDIVVETKILINSKMAFELQGRTSFLDIFFESPDPKTFINNDASPGSNKVLYVRLPGRNPCSSRGSVCAKITVYTSGRIDLE